MGREKERAEQLNRGLKKLGEDMKTAGMFEKPAIAEQMLRKSLELNELLIRRVYAEDK